MSKGNTGVLISTKKVIYNIKSHLKIIAVALVISTVMIMVSVMSPMITDKPRTFFKVTSTLQIRTQTQEGVDPLILEAQKIVEEFDVYILADGVRAKINEKLKNAGYDSFSSTDNPKFSVTNNIITMKIQGYEKDRTNFLSVTFLETFADYVRSFDNGVECVVLDNSMIEETDSRGTLERVFSINSLLILLFGVFIGFAVIVVFIFLDDRIYIKEDLLFITDLRYLYTVDANNTSREIAEKIINHYKKIEPGLVVVSIKDSDKFNDFEETTELIAIDKSQNVKCLDEKMGKVIIFFVSKEDTRQQALQLMHLLQTLEKEVVGFILFE